MLWIFVPRRSRAGSGAHSWGLALASLGLLGRVWKKQHRCSCRLAAARLDRRRRRRRGEDDQPRSHPPRPIEPHASGSRVELGWLLGSISFDSRCLGRRDDWLEDGAAGWKTQHWLDESPKHKMSPHLSVELGFHSFPLSSFRFDLRPLPTHSTRTAPRREHVLRP